MKYETKDRTREVSSEYFISRSGERQKINCIYMKKKNLKAKVIG